jgi:DNA-binding NtrC family response regulator
MATILVVDDERPIREIVTRALERRGHRVIACPSASSAQQTAGPIDLLLVDLVLPDINGRQLAEAMRGRWPNLPVILMSGYLAEQGLMPHPPSAFLQKPMLPSAVVQAVEALLKAV